MSDALQHLRAEVRAASDVLADDYIVRRNADPAFDADGFFSDLRRLVEARALTLQSVRDEGGDGRRRAGRGLTRLLRKRPLL
jgi:hypothetical protein